jgi:DNA-binding CsgD family transcriptional regulator
MLHPHYEIKLSQAEHASLETLLRAGKTPQQTVKRAAIILLAQQGLANQAIADELETSRNLVQKWRRRVALALPSPPLPGEAVDPAERVLALQDLPRSGRPPGFSPTGPAHRRGRGMSRGGRA